MKSLPLLALTQWLLSILIAPFVVPPVAADDGRDWVKPMQEVHARFTGSPGTLALFEGKTGDVVDRCLGNGQVIEQVLAGAAAADEFEPAQATVTLKKGDSIIFFGDSLTQLAGQEAPQEHVTKGYVRIVREKLAKTHKDLNIQVDWVATGGHTVPDLLKRVDQDVIAKKPSIVFIQIGCNDARRIPKETFRSGLEELIDKLQAAGIQVIQCSLTSVGEKHDGTNKDDVKLEEFAQVARDMAAKKKVPLSDLRQAFVAHWKEHNTENKPHGLLTYDGNHFNQRGHEFVAEQMLKKLK